MNDEQFIAAFENCSLLSEDFHHADHVRMAFLYLCRFPILEALQRVTRIRRVLPDSFLRLSFVDVAIVTLHECFRMRQLGETISAV